MPISNDGQYGETSGWKERMVCHDAVCSCNNVNRPVPPVRRLQAMQKMQNAAGGRGRGANGMPTPAQIQAMQVRRAYRSRWSDFFLNTDTLACNAPGHVATNATTTEERWWYAGNDEGHDARSGR